jgi:ATP-dependent DNA helicase RecG
MTVFGDLDVSTITGLPSGRAGVETFTVPLAEHPGWESRIWTRMAEELADGRQAFVVCPAIDDAHTEDDGEPDPANDDAPKRAPATVLATAERMRTMPVLADRRIEVLHGRMTADEKDRVMTSFAAGTVDVLVATTVIEVGVDVPNASMMAVLDADRFGVSQLHQLRGRIGRGQYAGVCLLVTAAEAETTSRERVDAVSASDDGFELARVDLELRREGDVLGERQSGGRSSLNLLRVVEHADLIVDAREEAERVLEPDPQLDGHPALREALARRLDESDAAFLGKN